MEMESAPVTFADLTALLGVSETTVKSYRRKFPDFFPTVSRGKPIRFQPQVVRVAQIIREGFARNLSVPELRAELLAKVPGAVLAGVRERPAQTAPAPKAQPPLAADVRDLLIELVAAERATAAQLERLCLLLEKPTAAPAPANQPRETIIQLTNSFGDAVEYRMKSRAAQAAVATVPIPPQSGKSDSGKDDSGMDGPLWTLPLVVKSEQGEFLGVAGRAHRNFSLRSLADLLKASGLGWSIALTQGPRGPRFLASSSGSTKPTTPRDILLDLESTVTPKGNAVVRLTGFQRDAEETPTANLYILIRDFMSGA